MFVARGLTRTYQMGDVLVHALRGVDLELMSGEFVVLLGPSGSGKSTLLNILGGLDVPTSGSVLYFGEDLTRVDEATLTMFRRNHVGFIFQFYNLIPSLTARENVALVTEIASEPFTPEEALALVGLEHRLDHFPSQLSGGEQQRTAIARALSNKPDILLADEPTGNLDPKTSDVVFDALIKLVRQEGLAAFIATHDQRLANRLDRIFVIRDQKLVEVEKTDFNSASG